MEDAAMAGPGDLKALDQYRQARAEIAQLDLKERRGEVISRGEVQAESIGKITTVKAALMGLARAVAPELTGLPEESIRRVLHEHVRRLICQFSGQTYRPLPVSADCPLEPSEDEMEGLLQENEETEDAD